MDFPSGDKCCHEMRRRFLFACTSIHGIESHLGELQTWRLEDAVSNIELPPQFELQVQVGCGKRNLNAEEIQFESTNSRRVERPTAEQVELDQHWILDFN